MARLLLAVALAASTLVSATSSPFAKKSEINVPAGWQLVRKPAPESPISLRFGLASAKWDELERELEEISSPSSPRWREHLSKEQVEALVAPHPDSLSLVEEYLASHGISRDSTSRTPAQDWITITIPVSQAERLLDTEYGVYQHTTTGKTVLRTPVYSLPEHLHGHIDVVQPTNYFGNVKAMSTNLRIEEDDVSKKADASVAPPFNLTLATLAKLYKFDGYVPKAKSPSKIGITGYLEQYANLADLKQFYAINKPKAVNSTLKVVSIAGAINSQNITEAGIEANLDVQFAGGITYPIPNIFYTVYGRGQNTNPNISYEDNGNEPYDIFIGTLLKQKDKDLPQTISTSYGEDERDVPYNYAKKVCQLYAQLGARGVSALHASGDGGVGNGDATTPCSTPNRFGALFPAGCPYITAIGATYLIPETTVDFSGGGFSDYFPRPSYQNAVVPAYIKSLGKTYNGLYNKTGRGWPDAAAQGSRFEVVYQGKVVHVSGTSASTPAFAGVVQLLNDALIAKGRKPLGFLNPWLYSVGRYALNDITTGSNPGCGTPGFNATRGWDPATGFGTPDFAKLRKVLGV